MDRPPENFRVDFALQVDQLTMVMLLVVTGVGLLIHIYSTGYMAHEGGYYRFFSYLNLFMFFMLTLVMAANLVVLFVGWEGVGLCSYLLIGFWFRKKSATDAGKKAFITTRIGDFGFTVGMLLVFWTFDSLDFRTIFAQAEIDARGSLRAHRRRSPRSACLLLGGAVGKSAQLPSVRLAARRHGRPHAGQRVDSRRDHGDRGRVHGRAHAHPLLARADGHAGRRA